MKGGKPILRQGAPTPTVHEVRQVGAVQHQDFRWRPSEPYCGHFISPLSTLALSSKSATPSNFG